MKDVKSELKVFATKIEKHLKINYSSKSIGEMYKYAISGGKRLRPSILLASCGAVGGDLNLAVPAAVAVELLHKFTLVHDDIIDNDELRRGRPTFHTRYGVQKGILMGDILCSEAFIALGNLKHPDDIVSECYSLLSKAYKDLCIGEFLDITLPLKSTITEKEYFNLLYLKAGSLLETSAKIGALLGGGKKNQVKSLGEFGRNLALSMQMLNDIKDNLNKEPRRLNLKSSDIQENKWSVPLIYALKHLPKVERVRLQKIMQKETKTDSDINTILSYFNKTGSLAYVNNLINQHFKQARNSLRVLKDSKYREFLESLSNINVDKWYWSKK